MTWDGTERRQHKRHAVKRLGVQYARSRLAAMFGYRTERYLVVNLSLGGLLFITKEALKSEQKLLLTLSHEDVGPLTLRSRVVWVRKSAEHDAYRVGLRFDTPSAGQRERLQRMLDGALPGSVDLTTGIYLREIDRL